MHPKQLLGRYNINPKQSLGQNFLFDEGLLGKIVAAAELSPDDEVLEIGPGVGALTSHLAAAAHRVIAVELDQRLLPVLESELAGLDNVTLIHDDILNFDPSVWFRQPYQVVANVPYYITGAILRHLLSGHLLGDHRPPRRLVMTVQKEVAQRLTAEPPKMSLLAVSVQYYGRVKRVATIKAGAFWPRPDVDSAVIRLDVDEIHLRGQPPVDETAFFRVVRIGFSEKRKQLKNNLRKLGLNDKQIAQALEEAGVDGRRRAETLSLEEWHKLVDSLESS